MFLNDEAKIFGLSLCRRTFGNKYTQKLHQRNEKRFSDSMAELETIQYH